jgi:hypothetical protein
LGVCTKNQGGLISHRRISLLQIGVQRYPQLLAGLLLDDLDPAILEVALAHADDIGLALAGVAGEPNGAAEILARMGLNQPVGPDRPGAAL